MFQLQYLDHIAIRVRDVEKSALWYEEVLGLKRVKPREWGAFPIMMLAGKTGIALFPAKTNNPKILPEGDWLVPFHFAFQVSNQEFEKVKQHFEKKNIAIEFQDLIHFHSIFISDPDNYKIEITTQVKLY
ncbi:VOC family protein [Saprospiraceae bacterium]|nr:VOC family protein [Bacteroidota bacterium]MDB4727659.1 VOC family protein [Saprospiraceae bacterium]